MCRLLCNTPREGGDTSPNFQLPGTPREKKWTQSDLRFCENERLRSKPMKKGVSWIEKQGENLYKMLKIC